MKQRARTGQLLARGTSRHLVQHDYVSLEEFSPAKGIRVDVFAVGRKGEIWIVECKSSRADYQTDNKWQGYLAYCDRYFWAVNTHFPVEILPSSTGIIIADAYDAEIVRMADESRLAPARRKKLLLMFARTAVERLRFLREATSGTL